jgi:hypothetical protein
MSLYWSRWQVAGPRSISSSPFSSYHVQLWRCFRLKCTVTSHVSGVLVYSKRREKWSIVTDVREEKSMLLYLSARWLQQVPPKHSYLYTNTRGAIVPKGNIFNSIAVKISDPGLYILFYMPFAFCFTLHTLCYYSLTFSRLMTHIDVVPHR